MKFTLSCLQMDSRVDFFHRTPVYFTRASPWRKPVLVQGRVREVHAPRKTAMSGRGSDRTERGGVPVTGTLGRVGVTEEGPQTHLSSTGTGESWGSGSRAGRGGDKWPSRTSRGIPVAGLSGERTRHVRLLGTTSVTSYKVRNLLEVQPSSGPRR